ncbi:Flagellar basal-body rod protein FlgF [uncultured delta proteobacterium]|uniref:Flagellar basal-body rod protein FlgF n=1 Tax=uncultured delta proteobacterium TaxID=34034 RepID=A0A212JLX3_9DELT|nr:Flagellar basal-body rod protein FlgF [uncultured delta proteobacterium]
MDNAMYSALFGALSNEHRVNSIANNLANVNTTGYKRDLLAFKDTMLLYAHDHIMEPVASIRDKKFFPDPQHLSRTRIATSVTDFQQGGMKVTSAPLDLAISGEGFFKVATPDGEQYTRNGHFTINQNGTIVNERGWPVTSEGGEITIPQGTKNIVIAENGRVFADEELVGQIQIVTVDNLANLEKVGSNMYRAREGAAVAEVEVDPNRTWVAQGFLESANVDAVYEMVNMIEAQRQFEAYQKVMQTSDAIDREATTKVGRQRA